MVFALKWGNSLKTTQRVLFTKLGRTARQICAFKTRLCSPHFDGAAFDSRGNGQMIAELAAQEYPGSIFQVMLSRKWYAENFPKLKDAFEDGKTNIPDDPAIKDDYKVVGLTQGVPLITDRTGDRHNKRHGDSCIAKVMALFAYNELEGGAYQPYAYEPGKTKNDFLGKAYDVWDKSQAVENIIL